MTDIVSPAKRSQMMAGIRRSDTKPEMIVRKALHAMGYRYRLHDQKLPGRPDIVLPKYGAVIQVNGCFWHGHSCKYGSVVPKTRTEFWRAKISENIARDRATGKKLKALGWRVIIVWECSLKEASTITKEIDRIADQIGSRY